MRRWAEVESRRMRRTLLGDDGEGTALAFQREQNR